MDRYNKHTHTLTHIHRHALAHTHAHIPVPNLSEGADSVGGQLHGNKKCPTSGVTNYGRVWRKRWECDCTIVLPLLLLVLV